MKIWVTTNGRPSESADVLSKQDGFGRAIKGGKIKPGDVVINWGSSNPYHFFNVKILNNPENVGLATNKLKAFQKFEAEGVSIPRYTTDKKVAAGWEHVLFARTKLTGHSGEGIVVVDKGEEIPDAPLYTFYIFKEREFRVHVVNSKVIDTQRKIRDPNREVESWKIRSHQNGFIFARNGIHASQKRNDLAIAACAALGLDFGAVDIIEDNKGNFYVLEINTAPGLEGQTIESYANAFRGAYA